MIPAKCMLQSILMINLLSVRAMAKETVITNSIMKYINSLPRGIAEKVVGNSNQKGRADINACYKGYSIRIEVKTADNGNTASPIQKLNLMKWKKAGAYTLVTYTLQEVKDFINYIDHDDILGRL